MLSLITVNYNRPELTRKLLQSLARQTDTDFKLHLLDNTSRPETMAELEVAVQEYPWPDKLIFTKNLENGGYAAGNNIGIRQAITDGATWLVLINPDTVVIPTFIQDLRKRLDIEGARVVGIPLMESGGMTYAGYVTWLHSTMPIIHSLEKARALLASGSAYINGGAFAIHREVFEKIGMLDERYFIYFEDAEFSLRAGQAGFSLDILDAPITDHVVSASTHSLGAPRLLYYHFRNAHLFNWQQGPWYIKLALPFWSLFTILKQLIKLATLPSRRKESRAILAGVIDFYRGKFGKSHD